MSCRRVTTSEADFHFRGIDLFREKANPPITLAQPLSVL